MWGSSIVGFGSYHYKYASRREGDTMLVGFSPRKQNLVLFLFTPAAERLLPDIHAYRRAIVAGLRYQYVRHIGSERFASVIRTLLETGPEARDLWGRHEIVLPRRHSAIRVRHDRGAVEASTLMTSLSPRTWLMAAWLREGVQPPGW